jgi:hypothetical protein
MTLADIETPLCPFCGAAWTAAMLDVLERHSSGAICACCAQPARPGNAATPLMLPAHDLCCDACGKPIYRAPARTFISSIIETADGKVAPS